MVTKLVSVLICEICSDHTPRFCITAYTHALLTHGSYYLEGKGFFYILVGFSLDIKEALLGAPALFERILQGWFQCKSKTR